MLNGKIYIIPLCLKDILLYIIILDRAQITCASLSKECCDINMLNVRKKRLPLCPKDVVITLCCLGGNKKCHFGCDHIKMLRKGEKCSSGLNSCGDIYYLYIKWSDSARPLGSVSRCL